MEKYMKVIEDLRTIRGFKSGVVFEYNNRYDSIFLNFKNRKLWHTLDNEKSKTWERFCDIISDNDCKSEFTSNYVVEIYLED